MTKRDTRTTTAKQKKHDHAPTTPHSKQPKKLKVKYYFKTNNIHTFKFNEHDLDDEQFKHAVEELAVKPIPSQSTVQILLQSNQLTDKSSTSISKLLNVSKHIQVLDLSGNQFSGSTISSILTNNHSFGHVNLSWNNFGGTRTMQSISHFLSNSRIDSIDLHKNAIGPNLAHICKGLLSPTCTLKTLLIKNNDITSTVRRWAPPREIIMPTEIDHNVDHIMCLSAVLVHPGCTLTSLNLANNTIRDDGIETLSVALRTNTSLKILNVANNDIGLRGIRAICDSLTSNTTLTSIDLSLNGITSNRLQQIQLPICDYDECLFAMSMALRSNHTLTNLTFMLPEGCDKQSTYERVLGAPECGKQYGLEWLFKSLHVNQSLVRLDIRNTYLSKHTATELLIMLSTCNNTLKQVLFSSTDSTITSAIHRQLNGSVLETTVKETIDLPIDLLLYIFQFLSPKRVIRMRLVSKQFDALARDKRIWEELSKKYPTCYSSTYESFKNRYQVRADINIRPEQCIDGTILPDQYIGDVKLVKQRQSMCCFSKQYGILCKVAISSTMFHQFSTIVTEGTFGDTTIRSDDKYVHFVSGDISFKTLKKRWINQWVRFVETYRWKRKVVGVFT